MKISRPLSNATNLVLVEQILPEEDANFLKEFYLIKHLKNPAAQDWPYEMQKPEIPEDILMDQLEKRAQSLLKTLEETAKKLFDELYPDLKLGKRWLDYGNPNVMQAGDRMAFHDDGPPNSKTGNGVRSAAFVYYIATDIRGGELSYPELDYDYTPRENTAMLHKNDSGFAHGVNPVDWGWRISYGFFGFEDYNDDILLPWSTERSQGT